MRIGIDATWAAVTGTGTASYTRGLVEALVRRRDREYVLYFRPGDDTRNPLWGLNSHTVTRRCVDGRGQLGRTLASLSRQIPRDGLDLFHSPGFFLPMWKGPEVVTFHDVNMFLQWDKWWRPGMRTSWIALCAQTLLSSRLAARVLADSRYAADSVQQILRLPSNRVSVVYPGVDDIFFSGGVETEALRLRERHDLGQYLLFVGVLSPQKNLEGAIRALAAMGQPELKLAVAGREDGPYWRDSILPLVNRLGLSDRVSHLGTVRVEALPGLYAGAAAFLFPSFGEGFGLPPLEAMASGAPVVAADRSSLPEVLDGAALLVNPDQVEAIAGAIDRILSDGALRAELVRAGRDRAGHYRWDSAAEAVLEVYAGVA